MSITNVPRSFSRWLVLMLAALLPCLALALDVDETEQIKKIERQLAVALAKSDVERLAELIANDWKFVGSDGGIIGRDEMLNTLRSGQLKFESYELGPMQVRVYGEVAVVIGTGASKGSMAGETFDERDVFTDVFIRKDGKWSCVSTHSSDVPK